MQYNIKVLFPPTFVVPAFKMSTDGAVPPPPQLYSLKWGNHNRFLTQMLYSQCGDRKYTDMTVSLDDGNFFHCHKLVLSSCSDFFKSYFARSQCSVSVLSMSYIGIILFTVFAYVIRTPWS